jgi:hypothetical protein
MQAFWDASVSGAAPAGELGRPLARPRAITDDEHPILNYGQSPKPSRSAAVAEKLIIRFAIAIVLFVAAIALPHPHGIWYFGPRPQWLVAIDCAGIAVGRQDHPVLLGRAPLFALKKFVVSVPIWLIWRYVIRRRVGQPTAG